MPVRTPGVMVHYRGLIDKLLGEVKKGELASVYPLTERLIDFNKLLTNPNPDIPEEQREHLEDPAHISHYQAVNVEHLKEGRLELRDIPAQASFATLEKDLKVVMKAITAARQLVVKSNQEIRLTS